MKRRDFLRAGLVVGAAGVVASKKARGQAAPTPDGSCDQTTPGVTAPDHALNGATETWQEPWVWRPSDWPGQQLDLNVVENQSFGREVGFGNPGSVLWSYGGSTPGPTIRMSGDETLFVKLRNVLGPDLSTSTIGPVPDPNELTPGTTSDQVNAKIEALGLQREDFCLGEHANGIHGVHITNLHTHGLHVRPGRNPNGTHSDNVILRVMPQADLTRREQRAEEPVCEFLRKDDEIYFLRDDETAGQADYEFRIGDVQGKPEQVHPPGTHWYHPHCHGATHYQVSSGMAGFLIVEGDVDEEVNRCFTGDPKSPPTQKTGDWDYRERLILMQRVMPGNVSFDKDAPVSSQLRKQVALSVNGSDNPAVMNMRPGAVERWRVLNGSVDGRGYKHFMVLEGQYGLGTQTLTLSDGSTTDVTRTVKYNADGTCPTLSTIAGIEADKQRLWQLAIDGVTLVRADKDGVSNPRYWVKDLQDEVPRSDNPLAKMRPGLTAAQNVLENLRSVWKSPESIRATWVRQNEFYMGPANRTDLFFQLPATATPGQVFTIFARAAMVHADTPQQNTQKQLQTAPEQEGLLKVPTDIIVGWIVVAGDPVPNAKKPWLKDLRAALPAVPEYLYPVRDEELKVPAGGIEPEDRVGRYRTRTITYSGWGAEGYPLISSHPGDPNAGLLKQFMRSPAPKGAHSMHGEQRTYSGKQLENLRYAKSSADAKAPWVIMPPATRSMAIDGRKFNPSDPDRPRMLVDSAEEWSVFNICQTLWGDTDTTAYPQPGQYKNHFVSYPMSRKQGQERNAGGFKSHNGPQFRVVTRAIDHPFHMHQNPFWVTRIEIPDETGALVNILDEPRWMDAVWVPRNGGRVVFRSRFPDFVGTYVNHCHILLHEDNGMMQAVEVTPFGNEANYVPRDADGLFPAASGQDPGPETPAPPSPQRQWVLNAQFVDPNTGTGQTFPFNARLNKKLKAPKLK